MYQVVGYINYYRCTTPYSFFTGYDQSEVYQILPALESLSNQTISGMTQVLKDKFIGASTVTRNTLQGMLTSLLATQLNGILESREFTESRNEVPVKASVA